MLHRWCFASNPSRVVQISPCVYGRTCSRSLKPYFTLCLLIIPEAPRRCHSNNPFASTVLLLRLAEENVVDADYSFPAR